jgi:hypothetical protein
LALAIFSGVVQEDTSDPNPSDQKPVALNRLKENIDPLLLNSQRCEKQAVLS